MTGASIVGGLALGWFFSAYASVALAPCTPFGFPVCIPDIPTRPPDPVNPIDGATWGAVALSTTGRCYAILAVVNRFVTERYAVLPAGSPCVGSAATRATITATEWPPT